MLQPTRAQAEVNFSEKVCRKQSSLMSKKAFSCPHSLSRSKILGYNTLLHYLLVFRPAAEECVLLSFLFLSSCASFFHLVALRVFSFSYTQDSSYYVQCRGFLILSTYFSVSLFNLIMLSSHLGKYYILPLLISYFL